LKTSAKGGNGARFSLRPPKCGHFALRSFFVGVGGLLCALFLKQHADTLAHGLVCDSLQQPLKVLDVQALNEPIHDAPPRVNFRDFFRELVRNLDGIEVCARSERESNLNVRHHTQLKIETAPCSLA
jgi:hypothetical protein